MGLITKIKNWRKAENPAPVNIINIVRVLRAAWRKLFPLTPKHIREQAAWRLTQVKPACKMLDSCTICGCEVSSLVYEDSPCEGFCYPEMMDKKVWNMYKKTYKVKL